MFYEKSKSKKGKRVLVAIAIVFSLFSFSKHAFAATISITPTQQQVAVDNVFKIRVSINTQSLYINNAEGTISFPQSVVDVVSIDTTNSIFGLWVEQPSFSNTTGTITFNGGIANPGYNSTNGEVFSVIVRAKKAGSASFLFASASVRANDGLGTDVLSAKNSALVTIEAVTVQETPKEVITTTPTSATTESLISDKIKTIGIGPVFASLTHPDQAQWYPFKDGTLTWDIPSKSKGTQMLFDGFPDTVPTGALSTNTRREFKNIKDGVSYFHARYATADGWSPIATFMFHIDSIPPGETNGILTKGKDGKPLLNLEGHDTISGIDYFTVSINDKESDRIVANNNNASYALSSLPYLGAYDVLITAVDKAGNKKVSKTKITIDTLVPPTIDTIDSPIKTNKIIPIVGSTAFTQEQPYIFIKSPSKKVEMFLVDTDSTGKFDFRNYKATEDGQYEIWAQIINDHGEKSIESKHQQVTAGSTFLQKMVSYGVRYGYIVLLAALIIMTVITFDLHHKLLNDESALSKLVLDLHKKVFTKKAKTNDSVVAKVVEIPKKRKRVVKKRNVVSKK